LKRFPGVLPMDMGISHQELVLRHDEVRRINLLRGRANRERAIMYVATSCILWRDSLARE
jgi:hypothetical protein